MSENYISQRRRGAIRINVGPRHVVLRLSLAALSRPRGPKPEEEDSPKSSNDSERKATDNSPRKSSTPRETTTATKSETPLNALSPKSAADAAAKIAVAAFAPEPDDDSILPWKELFPYAVLSLGLDPRAFWELTPAELSTLLAWRKNRDRRPRRTPSRTHDPRPTQRPHQTRRRPRGDTTCPSDTMTEATEDSQAPKPTPNDSTTHSKPLKDSRKPIQDLNRESKKFSESLAKGLAQAVVEGENLGNVLRQALLASGKRAVVGGLSDLFAAALSSAVNPVLRFGAAGVARVADDIAPPPTPPITFNVTTPSPQTFRAAQPQIAAAILRTAIKGRRYV